MSPSKEAKGYKTSESPRRKDDLNEQRHNLGVLHAQRAEGKNTLRDLKRQIPSLAADF